MKLLLLILITTAAVNGFVRMPKLPKIRQQKTTATVSVNAGCLQFVNGVSNSSPLTQEESTSALESYVEWCF